MERDRPSHLLFLSFRGLRALYLLHLGLPLFVMLDVLIHWRASERSGPVLLGICGLWLVLGLGMLLLSRDRNHFLRRAAGPLVSIFALYALVLVLELTVRLLPSVRDPTPTLHRPGSKLVFHTDPRITPGIQGTTTFSVNEVGLRGPSLPREKTAYKIISIGGSTTECPYLDDTQEWPHLLMEEMNRREKNRLVWVANAGTAGKTTVDHLMLLQTLPVLHQADTLVFLIGANDLMDTLAFDGAPTQAPLEADAEHFRELLVFPTASRYPLFKRLKLYSLARRAADVAMFKWRLGFLAKRTQVIDYTTFRKKRATSPRVPLPDLQIGLREYGERVLRIQEECQSIGVRCLFVTQPSMWRGDLNPSEKQLLWFGWVGSMANPKGYVSVADASAALDAYNHKLLDLCHEHGLECFDLAPLVPKDTSAFFDDFHFNIGGARIVALTLAQYLASRPPFSP